MKKTKEKSAKSLVIVESPGKVKTISKFLGKDFLVRASIGHVRDLPGKGLGIDIKNNFEPVYEILEDKTKVVSELKELAEKSDYIYLAQDPDREGEAIAWHLHEIFNMPKKIRRIVCNEITKDAIKNAIKHPRKIDIHLVEAQQARRILDRLVGYKISPLLWKKVGGKSAGRVQSVALRLVIEREQSIKSFKKEEYWSIHADFEKEKVIFTANLYKWKTKTITSPKNQLFKNSIIISNKKVVDEILNGLKDKDFIVSNIETKESFRHPQPPFITSTLQRACANLLGFAIKRIMKIAQELYEGVEIGEEGPVGLITYMRTDSTRIAKEAQEDSKNFIVSKYGKEYYPKEPRVFILKKKNVQDAHEAIRPTSTFRTPESMKTYLTGDQFKVYKLIWERFTASQMQSAKLLNHTIEITAGNCLFHSKATSITFNGFLKAFEGTEDDSIEEDEDENKYKDKNIDDEFVSLPDLNINDKLKLKQIVPKQHFTEPPPRYNEASLVKKLEELGIGRPSTYASSINTVLTRRYVEKIDKKALKPTMLGEVVTELLVNHFPKYIDYDFTAKMEENLDEIEEAKQKWDKMLSNFYSGFSEVLKKAQADLKNVEIKSEHTCPNCKKPMVLKGGRFGPFLGCSGYPECKTILNLTKSGEPAPKDKETDKKCPQCNGSMIIRHGPYGEYLQCTSESCKHRMALIKSIGIKCPQKDCDGELVEKRSRRGKTFYGCTQWSKTKCTSAFWNRPVPINCPECQSLLTIKITKSAIQVACPKKECDYKREATSEEIEKYAPQKAVSPA